VYKGNISEEQTIEGTWEIDEIICAFRIERGPED
jgi:hypothetical protein